MQVLGSRAQAVCGTRAQLLCDTQDLPSSGIEPVSPALASRLFSTEPPGKPFSSFKELVLSLGPPGHWLSFIYKDGGDWAFLKSNKQMFSTSICDSVTLDL